MPGSVRSSVNVPRPVISRGSSRRRMAEPKMRRAHSRPPIAAGGRLHGAHDVLVAGAAAQVALQAVADLLGRRDCGVCFSSSWVAKIIPGVQKPHCRPCLSQNASCSGCSGRRARQPLDGRHRGAVGLRGQARARLDRHAVDEHRARAALAGVAADLGAGEAERRRGGSGRAAGARPLRAGAADR